MPRQARDLLRPYRPDFNPIENMWSKVKSHLRKGKTRTFDAVVEAVREVLRSTTQADYASYFAHGGYRRLTNMKNALN